MKTSSLAICTAAGLMPLAAIAQDLPSDDSSDNEGVFLGTIVLDASTVPADGDEISVTSEGLALSNPADLSELFVAEPTISVGSSIPMSQKLYVNGVEENNLAISIDGARQNNKVFHHNTTTLIDPALLKAARIDPGVAPADAGPGALAGALAYETKDVADLLAEGRNFGGRYKLEYDTNGDIITNSASIYGRSGPFEYLGFLKYGTGGLRQDGTGADIVGSGTSILSGLAKFAYETQNGGRFEFSVENVADDEARPYRANVGAIIGGRPTPLTRPYDLQRQNFVLSYTTTAPTAMWDPTIRLSYSSTELLNDETTLPGAQRTWGQTDSFSGTLSNRFQLNWGEVNAGLDFYNDKAAIRYDYFPDPAESYATDEKLRNIGLFAQARMEPTSTSRLSFGLRVDFQEFTGSDGSTHKDQGLSGNISGEIDVTDRITLSAGYSHAWGGVDLAENYIINPGWAYPASGLEAVTADNAFIAAAYDGGSWSVDGKLFETRIDNARAASWRGGPSGTIDLQARGFELGFSKFWEQGFFRAGFASIDTELDGRVADSYTGNYLTMPLGEFFTFQAAHRFDNGLLIGGDAQIALDHDDTYDLATGGRGPTLPGYAVANIFAEYEPRGFENMTLRAEVNNLFDRDYSSRATYGQEFVGEVVPLKEPGRSFKLSLEYVF